MTVGQAAEHLRRLAGVLDEALAAQGVAADDLRAQDLAFVDGVVRGLAARFGSRRRWEAQVGELLTNSAVLALTGWSKQALSKAVHDGRVLKLTGAAADRSAYPLQAFDDDIPARPLPGLPSVLVSFAAVDPTGWSAASWLTTPQPELAGRTPRQTLLVREAALAQAVTALAAQAGRRLAA